MTAYWLESGFCLTGMWVVYKVFLEREKMHYLKRYYLLASLLTAFLVPFVAIEVNLGNATSDDDSFTPIREVASVVASRPDDLTDPMRSGESFWLLIYLTGVGIMLFRLLINLYRLFRQIHSNSKISYDGATLVLIRENVLPHTFLNYLFINEQEYHWQRTEPELLTHELAHIRQKHSLDILLIESLIVFFWFNPILFLFKRAIQLNHEFLADEVVTRAHHNVASYQYLLLRKLTVAGGYNLTSNLTFQTTKQRLLMMTKQTSVTRTWMAGGTSVILTLLLVSALGLTLTAQTPPATQPDKLPKGQSAMGRTEPVDANRWAGKWVMIHYGPKTVKKKYDDLTPDEKKQVRYLPPLSRQVPTDAQIQEWKNPKKFGVWVDGKRRRDFANSSYKPSDIASYWGSYVHKNARQPEGYLYQMELMTHAYYEAYLKEEEARPSLHIFKKKLRPG